MFRDCEVYSYVALYQHIHSIDTLHLFMYMNLRVQRTYRSIYVYESASTVYIPEYTRRICHSGWQQ